MRRILPIIITLFSTILSAQSDHDQFPYGVASGDPLTNAVIIWTKVEPVDTPEVVNGMFVIAMDESMRNTVQRGIFSTTKKEDYTVKIDVRNLRPGRHYYYQFMTSTDTSVVGRTKTAPAGPVENVKMAIVSCSNYQAGFFNGYRNIAKREVDVVVHLGDYIYEYQNGGYGDSMLIASEKRVIEPRHEIVSLDDYRQRYATYRRDKDLQRVHQMHPFITVWDDHESANNSHVQGAQNHQEGEGDWAERKAIARQAYAEWLPIRGAADRIYRKFIFGDLVDLIMLDTRLEGRDSQIMDIKNEALYAEDRTMLGQKQKEWLLSSLKESTCQWKVLGNQVMFAEYNIGWAAQEGSKYTPDQLESIFLDIWDGYPAEREDIIQFIDSSNIDDVVIVTGDVHCSFAYDVANKPSEINEEEGRPVYDPDTGEGSVAVEFVTPGVTSANYDEFLSEKEARRMQKQINNPLKNGVNPNPHMKYADLMRHGYMLVDFTPDRAKATWYYTRNVLEVTDEEDEGESWMTKTGSNHLIRAK